MPNKFNNTISEKEVTCVEKEETNEQIDLLREQNKILQEQNQNLAAQMKDLQNMLQGLQMGINLGKTNDKTEINNPLNDIIKIVHLRECAKGLRTVAELSNVTLSFTKFGEERTLDRRQAEELCSKFRFLFTDNWLAVSAENKAFAENMQVPCMSEFDSVDKGFAERLGKLSLSELERVYEKSFPGIKSFILGYFKRKIVDDKDPQYKEIHKIELLNRLSEGGMSDVLLDLKVEAEKAKTNK